MERFDPTAVEWSISAGTSDNIAGWDDRGVSAGPAVLPFNISIFGSLTQTATLHGNHPLEMFRALFKSSAAAQDVIFGHLD